MSGLSRFSGRVVAASIGLLGASETYALPEPNPVPRAVERWVDPVVAAYPRASVPDGTMSAMSAREKLELERQIEALEDISARLDTVIESLGFLAKDLADQFASARADGAAVAYELKETIDRFRTEREDYESPSRGRIVATGFSEACYGEIADPEGYGGVRALQAHIVEQERMLKKLKVAIQAVYGATADEIPTIMGPLEAVASDWLSAYGYEPADIVAVAPALSP